MDGAAAGGWRSGPPLHPISVELEVPFHDVDGMQIVWHGNYYKYLELARTRLLRSRGLDLGDVVGAQYAFLMIESRCRHTAPLRYRDRARIVAWFRDIKYRICVRYDVLNLTQGTRAAHAHTVLATTDLAGKLLLRTPRPIFERLQAPPQRAEADVAPGPEHVPDMGASR